MFSVCPNHEPSPARDSFSSTQIVFLELTGPLAPDAVIPLMLFTIPCVGRRNLRNVNYHEVLVPHGGGVMFT